MPRPSARPDPGGLNLPLVRAALERRLDRRSRAPLAVAFSGGSDSTALLLAAMAWAEANGRPVIALTVDHGLQPLSAGWTARAARVAARLGAGFRALAWSGEKPARGLPAAARRARHALLAQAAREAGASVLLMGHTADDLAEAAAMRRAGSSVGSPAEWSPSPVWPEGHGAFLLRPLLGARRADLRALLAAAGEDWIEDPANSDLRYARARARAYLNHQGHREHQEADAGPEFLGELGVPGGPAFDVDAAGVVRIDRQALTRRLLAAACACAGGGERLPRRERVLRLLQRIRSGEAFTASLAGARIEAGDQVHVMREPGAPLRAPAAGVWDGRFLIQGGTDAGAIVPLRGLAARLAPDERRALRKFFPPARASLPVWQRGGKVSCAILAQSPLAGARVLVGERLAGACGGIAREEHLLSCSDGEPRLGALS